MATRYPIILAHGILMKRQLFRAFVHIQKKLSEAGYHVYIANTDGLGTIENNAVQLKKEIETILEKEGAEKINIIAHSKGGLESVHMIERLDMGEKVASLTTLCTPHRGSQVATRVTKMPSLLLKFIAFWFNLFYKILQDERPDAITACKQLESKVEIATESLTTSHEIYCQSYSATMHKASSDWTLSIPFLISRRYENDASDGMVSNSSAKFAEYKGNCIEDDSISHNEIVCFMTKRKKKEKVVAFYHRLLEDLAERGF